MVLPEAGGGGAEESLGRVSGLKDEENSGDGWW